MVDYAQRAGLHRMLETLVRLKWGSWAGVVVVGSALLVVCELFLVILWLVDRGPRNCAASGGKWASDRCIPKQTDCEIGTRRISVGAAFGDGCNVCECESYGIRCTSVYCQKYVAPGDCSQYILNSVAVPTSTKPTPNCPACIYDPGCDAPVTFCGRGGAFAERPYCGCDGKTFVAQAPNKPYRYLGECR